MGDVAAVTTRAVPLVTRRCSEVAERLSAEYGDWNHHNLADPLDELMFIMCSVKTAEIVYLRVFDDFKTAFPISDALVGASEQEIARSLARGGLQRQKAAAIRALLDELIKRYGSVTLEPLRVLPDAECEAMLTSLPGVGKKVARCVMMYSLEREVLPVDTHCWRIVQRLGWFRATTKDGHCSSRDMDRVQAGIPRGLRYGLHVNLVSHGREVCVARRPDCESCVIATLCKRGGVSKRELAAIP